MIELLYFTGKGCGVCQVLKPKLLEALEKDFSKVQIQIVDVEEKPEIAGQHMVFTLPVVIIKLHGKEVTRFARSFSVHRVLEQLRRLDFELINEKRKF